MKKIIAIPSSKVTFGWELILDLYDCNSKTISDDKAIRNFAKELWRVINVISDDEPSTPSLSENIKHKKGYSLVQLIDTNSIIGHFSEYTYSVYLNIFSVKKFEIEKVERFSKEYFEAKSVRSSFIVRK